jgi:DinB family protein
MPTLHDEANRSQIINRLRSLRLDSPRRWGRMSADQMLWHVNGGLSMALGQMNIPPQKTPLPRPIMRLLALSLPWPKGWPTMPMFVASGSYDFDAERARCVQLIEQMSAKALDEHWPRHPLLGQLSGRDASRLQARHLDHHLRQFGV